MEPNPYESPRETDTRKRTVGGIVRLPVMLLTLLGPVIVFIGFWYDVMFAGIPYQDPTPAMQASYDFHQQVASIIRLIGEAAFVVAIGALLLIGSATLVNKVLLHSDQRNR